MKRCSLLINLLCILTPVFKLRAVRQEVSVTCFPVSEVLLVLPSLGVQVKTQYWFGHQETQFFDQSQVKGIVINEAITMVSTGLVIRRHSFFDKSQVKGIVINEAITIVSTGSVARR